MNQISFKDKILNSKGLSEFKLDFILKDFQEEEIKFNKYSEKFTLELTKLEKVYCYLNEYKESDISCLNCKNKVYFTLNHKRLFCSVNCKHSEKGKKIIKDLQIKGMKDKFGVANPSQISFIKEKIKDTLKKKYNVDHNWQIRDKKEFQERLKKIMIEKYGVDNASKSSILRDRQRKSRFSFKSYLLPSGKEIKIQGFENLFLDLYFKNNDENNLIFGNNNIEKEIGIINYFYDNKIRRYYPDFYIKNENKIIEVKSIFTYEIDKNKNHAKKQACLDNNFNCEIVVILNKNGNYKIC